ncbi:aminodeoxychorismate lyase apoprotein [Shewanella psychrophila]|uniref:Aminodeoxychorismate lyase n=1 Tax=Shewanella psychrophila TaxID=225848 RepID=A0A1S6HLZ3_9GAMM|nr:aminodeoxychorismate lyase [Shewanella psychrophila]AQS36556.1 aminodeoxychorismate lyase apoprotein [Shewanella psychrophila]
MTERPAKVWVNGEFYGHIAPLDRGLAYGDGLFATMRIVQGKIAFLSAHLERLTQGAKRLGFSWSPSLNLVTQLKHLAKTEVTGCLKLLLSRGTGGRGYAAPETCVITEVISLHAIPSHYSIWQQTGISLTCSPIKLSQQPRLAGIKHLNRLEQVLIKSETLLVGYEDWLVIDGLDNIVESSMANLFFVADKHVVTPSISHSGVAGVMREQVIYALIEAGYDVEARPIAYSHLCRYQHVFMTNSLVGILDINNVDDIHFTHADFTHEIRRALHLTL